MPVSARRQPPPVCASDLENLRASGLTDATIVANGLQTVADCLEFPYRNLDGSMNGFARLRPHQPRMIDGKVAKYIQPNGSPLRAYFPAGSTDKLRDGETPVFITEGEKKALALAQLGLAAVGIGGIWCGCNKSSTDLIDDLAAIPWKDRAVYVVFDYDEKATTRRASETARTRLARALKAAGAGEVYNVQLPPGPEGIKQGVDDFLVPNGKEPFDRLVEAAIPVIKIIPPAFAAAPKPIPVIRIIPPALGEAAYHGPIGRFLRTVAPHTEATDAGVLAHLLPALGTIIGPGPHTHGTKQPARVNTVLVGPTSTGRKGTALAPVDEVMNIVDSKFWQEQRVGGLSTGEGLVGKVADKVIANEKENRIVFVEKRLYVVEEEFSKVLAHLRRDGNILSQILRESYDSGNLSVMTRKEPLQAFGAHIAITGHITPEELYDRFNHIEMANGFGNRFLWFAVKSDKELPRCQPIPEAAYREFVACVQGVSNHPPVYVPLANASMEKWENEIYPSLREDRPGFSGHLVARGSSMVLRLSLIYFLLDSPLIGMRRMVEPGTIWQRGNSLSHFWQQGIEPVHLDAAMAVWRYCEESVQMLFASRAGTFLADRILELLASGPMSKDELNDHLSAKQKAEAPGVLVELEQQGLVIKTTVKRDGPGRPATTWQLP
jgi:hypothetical protein